MLEFIDCEQEDAVAWRIDGRVSEEDMQNALSALQAVLDDHGQVCVYQEITAFGGVEFEAVLDKLQFFIKAGISGFRRIAVVTDKRWMQRVIGWENRIFRDLDMRAFSTEERDRAFNFLAYGGDSDPAPQRHSVADL